MTGYDPGLSIQSALKLPRDLTLADSIASAVSGADYISINIPYIKGENGTHGVIGPDVISHFKPGAVLLNFARGELVDSEALKTFLDESDGRYVSDFPDDLLWDHKNAVILPHLGASTEEAEDAAVSLVSLRTGRLRYLQCACVSRCTSFRFSLRPSPKSQASMAAETIRMFLETGAIRNSVNFPETALEHPEGAARITVVNENVPGVLAHITEVFAQANLNIIQQINHSRGDIAYNVIDVDTSNSGDVLSFKNLQEQITMLDGVINSRIIYGTPGTGFARNMGEGEYFV